MKQWIRHSCLVVFVLAVASMATAEDLYRVSVSNEFEAAQLRATGVDALLKIKGGYLVLTTPATEAELTRSGLLTEFIVSGVDRNNLSLPHHHDPETVDGMEEVFRHEDLVLYKVDHMRFAQSHGHGLSPLDWAHPKIEYVPPTVANDFSMAPPIDMDSLISMVSQDSLASYVHAMQEWYRVTGTGENYAARDWLTAKFLDFGYDSVTQDPFYGYQLGGGGTVQSYNVFAYKPGSVYPEKQVVVGAHFDAVPGSPGADDNASGTAAVLEFARVLKDIDTKMSFVFICFDSEESGLIGSAHYASNAAARGDDIVYMQNLDMIAFLNNDTQARLFSSTTDVYSLLWASLSDPLVGIEGVLSGSSGRSDHYPFEQNGYMANFVHEYNFSSVYHSPQDSTSYMDFDYMTRMVQASLATLYTVGEAPPPVNMIAAQDVGDGSSVRIQWEDLAAPGLVGYQIRYTTDPDFLVYDSIDVPLDSSVYTVDGLTEGLEYSFGVVAVADDGNQSLMFDFLAVEPNSVPPSPQSFTALPLRDGIRVSWQLVQDPPLDLDYYSVFRDGQLLPVQIQDTVFEDYDASLGSDLHSYYAVIVDTDGNTSDTVGMAPAVSRAATLEADRILAINRTAESGPLTVVDAHETGAFMREALEDYDYDYRSDTAALYVPLTDTLKLFDLLDYGVVVIGAETARLDDLTDGQKPLLDSLAYYLEIGGKAVVFGRWGSILEDNTVEYTQASSDGYAYYQTFGLNSRVRTMTEIGATWMTSSLVGATSAGNGYPNVPWDSSLTAMHSSPYSDVTGVPAVSFANLTPGVEPLYFYESSDVGEPAHGAPIAWRYLGEDYGFVYFDFPLSFMDRTSAIAALRKAVDDLMDISTDIGDDPGPSALPDDYRLSQNYPNPFNPTTQIEFYLPREAQVTLTVYNLLGQEVKQLVNARRKAGGHVAEWDGRSAGGEPVASGIYFYRLVADDYSDARKMILLK